MEKHEYILRQAVPEDAPEITEMGIRGLPGYPFEYIYNPALVAREISSGKDLRIVADSPNLGVVGTAVLELLGPMTEVKRVVVDPIMRNNGVAKYMTQNLVDEAVKRGLISWSDVRGDQIGMQRSALASGLMPICLEAGKHVVYRHADEGADLGPARETMVHMTSLRLDEADLHKELSSWTPSLRSCLINHLEEALNPLPKNNTISEAVLSSAAKVKSAIADLIAGEQIGVNSINEDMDIINVAGNKILVIKPDASGFILTPPNSHLSELLTTTEQIGLQIVTYYAGVSDDSSNDLLSRANMEPAMIRPWKSAYDLPAKWEVGWRRTMNKYENSLHKIQLDEGVEAPIRKFIERLRIIC